MVAASTEISRYFKSHDFKRALLLVCTLLVGGLIVYSLGYNKLVAGLCIGIFLTSFSDSQGGFRNRSLAMALSILLNVLILLIVNLIGTSLPFILLFIATAVPIIAFLSVYGRRASLFSFSGLLGIVLSLIRHHQGKELLQYIVIFSLGGLLYIATSSFYHWLTRKSQTNQQLGELAKLTAKFLQIRLNISKKNVKESDAQKSLLNLQIEIAEKQESLRALILSDRLSQGHSKTRSRHMLILIELIDIMELALANRSTFATVQNNVNQLETYVQSFIDLSDRMVYHLKALSNSLLDNKALGDFSDIEMHLQKAENAIHSYINEIGIPEARGGAIALRNYHDYLEKQATNITSLYRLFVDESKQHSLSFNVKKYKQFLPIEDYSPDILIENLSLQSPFLKHAIRLSVAMIIGYTIGVLFKVTNPYWILLTIVVIMRPSYGLTLGRSKKRVIGTIIGVVIAALIVLVTKNLYVYMVLALLSMLFAISMINRNYIVAAAGITLNVVFVYSLIYPNHWEIIQFRLIDTVIGAIISSITAYIVFPSWEYESIESALQKVLESNKQFLHEISNLYLHPQSDDTNYRLSRKQAFLNTTELNASFQRYMQDPKSKQKRFSNYYQLVLLNQSFLSSTTSLGNYIKNHHRSELGKAFKAICDSLQKELNGIQQSLFNLSNKQQSAEYHQQVKLAQQSFEKRWDELENERNKQISMGKYEIEEDMRLQLQEVRFIQQELSWLIELTQNMKEAVQLIYKEN